MQAAGLRVLHGLAPPGPPRGRIPRFPEVDPLADDLVVAELHDAHYAERLLAVVVNGVLVHPQVQASGHPMDLEGDASGVRGPERDDVCLAPDALLALRELEHGVVRVDLTGTDDVAR